MNSVIQDMRPGMHSDDPAAIRAALRQHGTVLLRRSSRTLDDFIDLSDTLMTPMVHHATNTIERDAVVGDPRTSTVNKGTDEIPLHREGSYAPACPDLLMLYCERPAGHGGAQRILCARSLPPVSR